MSNVMSIENAITANKVTDRAAPKPLPDGRMKVDKFDCAGLPSELASFVESASSSLQCPPDFIAVGALCTLASLLGNQAVIQPKKRDTSWKVYPTLWGMIVAPPSAKKTPALKLALSPLNEIEKELAIEHKSELDSHAVDEQLWEMKQKAAEKEAAKALRTDENKARAILSDIAESKPIAPTAKRKMVNDCTVEKTQELMSQNPNGLLYFRDELSGLLSNLAREENASNRTFLLESFNGNGRYTSDRIQRGTTIIENCTISILGGAQPTAIMPLVRDAVRGIKDDGLIQRFQLMVMPEPVKGQRYKDAPIDATALKNYTEIVRLFDSFDFRNGDNEPRVFGFSNDAQDVFKNWINELSSDIENCDHSPAYISHIQKMDKAIPTLALIFELIETKGVTSTISAVSIVKACAWSDYLKSHARAIYGMVSNSEYTDAKRIAKNKDKLGEGFTVRDITRKGWSGLTDKESIKQALELLTEYSHVYALDDTGVLGRKTTNYYWNRG